MVKKFARTTDWSYFVICLLLSFISVVTLLSVARHGVLELGGHFGDYKPFYTQILAVAVGLVAMLAVSLLDYRKLIEFVPLHILCWGLVLLTFIPGVGYEPPGTGSRSWIALPLGMSFQPTEIAKISFYLTFAGHLARRRDTLNRPRSLAPLLVHLTLPAALIHFQGDDGTATVFLAIGGIMLIAAGLNRWVVAGLAAATAAAAPLIWNRLLSGHQRDRILGLLSPELYADGIMYQQLQGRTAITNGGLLGRGLFQPLHEYVPRPENDFIFSYFAESCGFIGCLVLLGLLFALILKTLVTAYHSLDTAGALLCVGIFATLLYQTAVNLGMNLLLLPVMGVTLPFVSAGGTSVLMLFISCGLLLSVHRVSRTTAAGPPALSTTPKAKFFLRDWLSTGGGAQKPGRTGQA